MCVLPNLKYLPSGPLQEKYVNPWLRLCRMCASEIPSGWPVRALGVSVSPQSFIGRNTLPSSCESLVGLRFSKSSMIFVSLSWLADGTCSFGGTGVCRSITGS